VVLATAQGRVDLDVVSLFPEKYLETPAHGLRADLVQMAGPTCTGVKAFSGRLHRRRHGSANRYQWKDTIGDVAAAGELNRWQTR